jgi:uncharacterized protein (TIGR02594 family)
MDWFAVQTRLKELGFDPGPLDGIYGRQTRVAVALFQTANMVRIKWPGTVGEQTLKALFRDSDVKGPLLEYPWLDLAISKKGLIEGRDYVELSKFLKSDGATLGDPRKLPWCGDFVQTCIAIPLVEEVLPANPYLARNWMQFGRPIEPTIGAVMVFWRGKRLGIAGHVAFAVGHSSSAYYVIGGNQSDSVSVTSIAKVRLIGARWPITVNLPNITLPRAVGGVLSINEA